VLIVARAGLGTINHTLLTIESVRRRGLTVAGIVLNEAVSLSGDPSVLTNADEIEAHSGAPVLGFVGHGNTTELHRNGTQVTINWLGLTSATNINSTT
jgi:dethiobiotin synthetase